MTERETEIEVHAKRRLGTVLRGKYTLERLLGVGGMAVVYKATHRNQAEFAVKMLHPELSLREDVRTRFLREGYAANSIKHPGAVVVVDDDVAEDGAAFLVMELLEGVDVEQLWEESGRRLSPLTASAIVVQLLDVLVAAHAKGVVHRDIKPANLFVTLDGTLKVLDFGIARVRDAAVSGAGASATGATLLGTPAFMPPEQALAHSDQIDGQTDVWAVGATLFTLLSGHYVHEGENGQVMMVRAATTPARPVANVAEGVPGPIAEVVDRALAFDKAARWPSAVAMRDALQAACHASSGQRPAKAVLAEIFGPVALGSASTSPGGEPPPSPAPVVAPTTGFVSADSVSIPGLHRGRWSALGLFGLGLAGTAALVALRGPAVPVSRAEAPGVDAGPGRRASASTTPPDAELRPDPPRPTPSAPVGAPTRALDKPARPASTRPPSPSTTPAAPSANPLDIPLQ